MTDHEPWRKPEYTQPKYWAEERNAYIGELRKKMDDNLNDPAWSRAPEPINPAMVAEARKIATAIVVAFALILWVV